MVHLSDVHLCSSLEDVLENITHSICTLEFEDQRAFYNWATERSVPITRAPLFDKAKAVLADLQTKSFEEIKPFAEAAVKFKWKLGQTEAERELASLLADIKANPENLNETSAHAIVNAVAAKPEVFTPLLQDVLSATVKPNFFLLPHQYEFNRLNLTYVVMSKRKLIALVKEGLVDGWDDPRMPTLVGLRRRGYSPEAMRLFCDRVGVSKQTGSWIDYSVLEGSLRDVLDAEAIAVSLFRIRSNSSLTTIRKTRSRNSNLQSSSASGTRLPQTLLRKRTVD